MQERKELGKITHAEFGRYPDRPFLFGLQLGFEFGGCGIFDGGKYTINISDACKREKFDRSDALNSIIDFTNKTLVDAKVDYVSELIGKPVEITLESNRFMGFRILTEVI